MGFRELILEDPQGIINDGGKIKQALEYGLQLAEQALRLVEPQEEELLRAGTLPGIADIALWTRKGIAGANLAKLAARLQQEAPAAASRLNSILLTWRIQNGSRIRNIVFRNTDLEYARGGDWASMDIRMPESVFFETQELGSFVRAGVAAVMTDSLPNGRIIIRVTKKNKLLYDHPYFVSALSAILSKGGEVIAGRRERESLPLNGAGGLVGNIKDDSSYMTLQ